MRRVDRLLSQLQPCADESQSLIAVPTASSETTAEKKAVQRPFFDSKVGPSQTGGRNAADGLAEQGVTHVFTLTGGHVSPILVGCNQRGIHVIDVRDEATTVFAADAVARITGIPGVAIVTAGPGLTNVVTPTKNAQMAESPVIIFGGATAMLLKGRGSLQDIDQFALMRPHVKRCYTIRKVRDIIPTIRSAFALAKEGVPGPVFIEFPLDSIWPFEMFAQLDKVEKAEWSWNLASIQAKLAESYTNWHLNRVFADGFKAPPPLESSKSYMFGEQYLSSFKSSDLVSVLKRLNNASLCSKPVFVLGSQCTLHPGLIPSLVSAIEYLNLPVFLSGMARGLLGRTHPLQYRHKRSMTLKRCDFLLLCGVSCDFRLDYGRGINKHAYFAMVNLSQEKLGLNSDLRRKNLAIRGDPAAFIIRLAETAKKFEIKLECLPWKADIEKRESAREKGIITTLEKNLAAQKAQKSSSPAAYESPYEFVHPIQCCLELEKAIDDDSFMVADGGDFVGTASYILKPRKPLRWLDPGAFGTLGCGAGFGIGCKALNPDSEVWLLYGDGSFGWSVMECDTWKRMKLPVIAVIGNDACWSQMWRDQVRLLKDPVATELEYARYDLVAQGFGCAGILVSKASELRPAFVKAKELARQGTPVVINVLLSKSTFREGAISI